MKYGIGINDAGYEVHPRIGGIRQLCPIYNCWNNMLARCYSPIHLARRPSYAGCSVAEEWYKFSTFRSWMVAQEWQGMALDKDILIPGNKIYGPDTCLFVSRVLNSFVVERTAARGDWPIGVSWKEKNKKFQASCKNPFTTKQVYLGLYDDPQSAHLAWKRQKHEFALQLAALESNPRLILALSCRYA